MAGGVSIHIYEVWRGVAAAGLRPPTGMVLAQGVFDHPIVRRERIVATGIYEGVLRQSRLPLLR
jgi:hypothetical protein